MTSSPPHLSGADASAAVEASGWRVVLNVLVASVPVDSVAAGVRLAAAATEACGADADRHLRVDIRANRVEFSLADRADGFHWITPRDVELSAVVGAAVTALGGPLAPPSGARPVQTLEIAIDALDIPGVLPFWAAVFDYRQVTDNEIADPAGQGPTVWFQQMDAPRPERNRVHFDIAVTHDEAPARVAAALAAGGRLVSDASARSFWILADAEGNEVCVCTWQDRD